MLLSEAPNNPDASRRTSVVDVSGNECFLHIQELEQHLRSQIDNLEHLKLSVAEALSDRANNTGFASIEEHCKDLKMSLAEHTAFLNDLSERTESLQLSTSLFIQVNTKLKDLGRRRSSKRYTIRPQFYDDTHSELGWNPTRPRRNSNASEMSCVW